MALSQIAIFDFWIYLESVFDVFCFLCASDARITCWATANVSLSPTSVSGGLTSQVELCVSDKLPNLRVSFITIIHEL